MISAIAAIGKENRIIGNNEKIPWHIPEDFSHFKKTTIGHPIIMGKKTFETFLKPLPGRTHIVLTRDTNYSSDHKNVLIAHSLEHAFELAKEQEGSDEIFIIGGGQIYELALPYVERLYLTLVEGNFEGNVFFPEYSTFTKQILRRSSADENYQYEFVVLEK